MPYLIFLLLLISTVSLEAQVMSFESYNPRSTLVVPEHPTTRAKFPFIDVHNHQWSMAPADLDKLLAEMNKLNMAVMVNLSGRGRGSSEVLEKFISSIQGNHPSRFAVFTNIDFTDLDHPEWATRIMAQLDADVKRGARGLKIYKNLGMSVYDKSGKRVPIDDPRLDPVWRKCGELKIPVLIHSADPREFWSPYDSLNERWLELKLHQSRRHDQDTVKWERILAEQHRMFRKHPKTIFINAHLGWLGNDLARLGKLLDELPNMYVEIGAVISDLGRQPRNASQFLTRYQDRVLFGKDSWVPDEYATYFRVLETTDEYFPYHKKYHAFWRMYGLGLPDEILKKIYYKNALKIIPGLDRSLFPG